MRNLRINRLAVIAACSSLFVISLIVAARGTNASHAGGMDAMSIDLDPTGNTATSLGPRDECLVVRPGDTVTFDVTAEGIPAASPIIGFQYALNYPAGIVTVVSSDPDYLLGSAPGSELFSIDGPTPDEDGEWNGGAADTNTPATEEGSGVLERLTLEISETALTGTYQLRLAYAGHVDPWSTAWPPRQLMPAFLAVGTACDNLPTPATAAPTEPPPDVKVGVDHDGPPASIDAGPVKVPPGAKLSVQVVGYWPSSESSSVSVLVQYDAAVVDVVVCGAGAKPYNECMFGGGVIWIKRQLSDVEGYAVLADVGFVATGFDGECVRFRVLPNQAFRADAADGGVCIDADAPLPTPTPSPPPTPAPSPTPPFGPPTTVPTPTPSASAGPSPEPPSAVTERPGFVVEGPARPVALPATGGQHDDASAAPLSLIVTGGVAAVAAGAVLRAGKRR